MTEKITREQMKKFLAVMMSFYPNWHPVDLSLAVDAWLAVLQEFSFKQLMAALEAYVISNTSAFPPSVGQLIAKIDLIKGDGYPSEMVAWGLVSKGLRNGAYHAAEEFAKLPEAVQEAVGDAQQLFVWATSTDYNESVISSNFMRSYRAVVARKKELSAIPASVRAVIENTSKAMIGCEEK